GTCTAVTPRVCCAVSAVMADRPCTRWLVGGSLKEWCYVPGALAQLKRYLDTGIDAFFADDPGLARRALSGKTPR
ncbi:hypothetical protein, partial [Xanthomonas campestris]|uniref:hypothetical protein n=1 Tax=Xanthomonas campestris TaxID=339 RepID=UPI0032E51F8F